MRGKVGSPWRQISEKKRNLILKQINWKEDGLKTSREKKKGVNQRAA